MARAWQIVDAARQAEENLLKTMLLLQLRKGSAYVSDLAEELKMNLTTTYSAVNRAVKNGNIQPLEPRRGGRKSNKQALMFTPQGEAVAKRILDRHQTIHGWLIRLGVPVEEADEEACHMEHGMTDNTMELLKKHVDMATQLMGEVSCAPEIMRKMAQQMKEHPLNTANDLTENDKMRFAIERAGGIEGIEKKSSLIARAGGEERLSELLELVESLGGLENLQKEKDELLDIRRMIELRGGVNGLTKAFDKIDAMGGVEKISQLATLEKQMGGIAKLKKLRTAAKQFGGVENMCDLIEKERKIWAGIFSCSEDESR